MMRWWHHKETEPCPIEVALPSATKGISFQSRITARYRPGRAQHNQRDSAARVYLAVTAQKEAAVWQADQLAAAADAINAKLGRPAHCPDGTFRDLVGHIQLGLAPQASEALARLRADQAHVERLHYLRAALYDDPGLLLIDHLNRHPDDDIEATLEKYRRLADRLQRHEQWWTDVRTAWDDLASRTVAPQAADASIRILLDAILQLDRKLAAKHGLPPRAT